MCVYMYVCMYATVHMHDIVLPKVYLNQKLNTIHKHLYKLNFREANAVSVGNVKCVVGALGVHSAYNEWNQ